MRRRPVSRRGSTFLLVLAMLSILVLIAVALSYTARIESIASSNFAQSVQARAAAASGLGSALPSMRSAVYLTSPLQTWNRRSSASAKSTTTKKGVTHTESAGQASYSVTDLCGRVNMNTVANEKSLSRFLEAVFTSESAGGRGIAASERSRSVMRYRNPDTKQTTQTTEPDLRKQPTRYTNRFESINDLRRPANLKTDLFTEEELGVLENYVSVFSESPEVYNRSDGRVLPKQPLSSLNAEQLGALLKQAFPDQDERMLLQYAVNVTDYCDTDNVPTSLSDAAHPEAWHRLIGLEQTPLITEVYPKAVKSGSKLGDQGQYVELYNPWGSPLQLTNWRLVVGGGADGTSGSTSVQITAVIPSKGYLIITDNYDHPADDSSAGTGCFLAIFGVRKDNNLRKLIEQSGFDLPDENSYVTLTDSEGHVIDVFGYTSAASESNGVTSYQRVDPRVRAFEVCKAAPFEKPPAEIYKTSIGVERDMEDYWKTGNNQLEDPTDLLKIPTSYAGVRQSGQLSVYSLHPWQQPFTGYLETKARENQLDTEATTNLDAHVLDLFTDAESHQTTGTSASSSGSGGASDRSTSASSTEILYAYGKLNLNTCSKLALYSLNTELDGSSLITKEVVDKFESYRQSRLAEKKVPFENVSAFLVNLLKNPDSGQLKRFGKMLKQTTVSSCSFEVNSENRQPETNARSTRRTAVSRAKWTVTLDQQPYSLISYSMQP